MTKEEAWQVFCLTGDIFAYLLYVNIKNRN